MRRTSTRLRALLTAVAVLLSVLAAAEASQAVQLAPERGEITSERSPAHLTESPKTPPEECRTWRSLRAAQNSRHHLTWPALHWCACSVRAELRGRPTIVPTGREAVPLTTRSAELPLRHQVLRC